jgi:hypothetical protein
LEKIFLRFVVPVVDLEGRLTGKVFRAVNLKAYEKKNLQ